jgi:large subunit ribosomal protein L10
VALKKEDKDLIIQEANEVAKSALSAVVADYRGLTANQLNSLRKKARDGSVSLRVIRNTLAIKALEGTSFECLAPSLVGPTILAFSIDDPGAAARIIKEFAQTNDKLSVKALSIGGKVYGASDIDVLAKLPTRDQALSILMQVMLAPITKFVRTANDIPTRVVRVIAAVRDQKQNAA